MDRLDVAAISILGPLLAYEWMQWHVQGFVFGGIAFLVLISAFLKYGVLADLKALEPHGRRVSKLLGSIGDVKNPDQIRKGAVALCATVQGKNGVAIKQSLIRHGAVDVLLTGLTIHGRSSNVANVLLGALIALSNVDDFKKRLQDKKRKEFWSKLSTVMNHQINNLDQHNPAHRTESLSRFPKHEELQQWGFFCLFNMSYEHVPNKLQLVSLGGLQQVLDAMQQVPHVLQIQRIGLAILFNTLRKVNDRDTSALRALALGNRMVDAVEVARRNFWNVPDIQAMAQQILESMNLEIDMTPQLERGQSNASSCDETIPLSPVSAF